MCVLKFDSTTLFSLELTLSVFTRVGLKNIGKSLIYTHPATLPPPSLIFGFPSLVKVLKSNLWISALMLPAFSLMPPPGMSWLGRQLRIN